MAPTFGPLSFQNLGYDILAMVFTHLACEAKPYLASLRTISRAFLDLADLALLQDVSLHSKQSLQSFHLAMLNSPERASLVRKLSYHAHDEEGGLNLDTYCDGVASSLAEVLEVSTNIKVLLLDDAESMLRRKCLQAVLIGCNSLTCLELDDSTYLPAHDPLFHISQALRNLSAPLRRISICTTRNAKLGEHLFTLLLNFKETLEELDVANIDVDVWQQSGVWARMDSLTLYNSNAHTETLEVAFPRLQHLIVRVNDFAITHITPATYDANQSYKCTRWKSLASVGGTVHGLSMLAISGVEAYSLFVLSSPDIPDHASDAALGQVICDLQPTNLKLEICTWRRPSRIFLPSTSVTELDLKLHSELRTLALAIEEDEDNDLEYYLVSFICCT